MADIVTRFAPSPTGYLHVGGARTALFNYLFSRRNGGYFRLRIEDTDRERSRPEMTAAILEGLSWLGLNWDGEVIFQGANVKRHQEIAHHLVEKGRAYRCFCSKAELEAKRQKADRSDPRSYLYDGTCRRLSEEQIQKNLEQAKPFSIRFKTPEGSLSWDDAVHGIISVQNEEIGDFIILRSDNSPTYQLAVVVDDHDMGITHVIRGDDHISNTPKQILLFQALEWAVPQYAHVPLILGPDKKRLSKRHGATSVDEIRQMGILPEALFNYLCLLGWTPPDDREIMSPEEIIQRFSLEGISKTSAVFDDKKLLWMNGIYIRESSPEDLFNQVSSLWKNAGFLSDKDIQEKREWLIKIIRLHQPRARVLNDFVSGCIYYFRDPAEYDPKGIQKYLKNPEVWQGLEQAQQRLKELSRFTAEELEKTIRRVADELNIPAAKIIHPIRLALTGSTASPGLFEVMEILGTVKVSKRLENLFRQKNSLLRDVVHQQE
ncbi:MAG: glutamate--tRNA ligase [Calditrichia bacterium]